jgi:hypothetical protein
MMWEIAEVYVSSSSTIEGLFMRFGAGGGAMRAVEALRFVSALEFEDDITRARYGGVVSLFVAGSA